MATEDLRERIVDTALDLAEERSWEAVRLHDVATRLAVSLEEVRSCFREKEEVADAWFDRADSAMLRAAEAPEFLELGARERLHKLIMTWLDALAPHRRATRQIIMGKLEPGHFHVQIPGLLRVSRTVQWIREAAQRDATYLRRALEETALTSIYLTTFARWMWDDSHDSADTGAFLASALAAAERFDHLLYASGAGTPSPRSMPVVVQPPPATAPQPQAVPIPPE